jgi:hypothetical protein
VGIPDDTDTAGGRRDLLEQFEPFCSEAVVELHHTGSVAAGVREAVDKAVTNRVDRDGEDHGDGAGGLQQRRGGRAASGDDDIRIFRDHLGDLLADFGCVRRDAANQELQIASFAPAKAAQRLDYRGDARFIFEIVRGRLGKEDADTANPRLLGARRPWQDQRATEGRNQLSSSHAPRLTLPSPATLARPVGRDRGGRSGFGSSGRASAYTFEPLTQIDFSACHSASVSNCGPLVD